MSFVFPDVFHHGETIETNDTEESLTNDEKIEDCISTVLDDIQNDYTMPSHEKIELISKMNAAQQDLAERRREADKEKHKLLNCATEIAKVIGPSLVCVVGMMYVNQWEKTDITNRNMFSIFMEGFKNGFRKK